MGGGRDDRNLQVKQTRKHIPAFEKFGTSSSTSTFVPFFFGGDMMFNQLGSKKNGCDWKMILKPFWGRSFFGAKLVKLQGVVYVSCLEGTGLKE